MIDDKIRSLYHKNVRHHVDSLPRWRGVSIDKYPGDLILYAEQIFANRPDYIVETGTMWGGSASFFADILFLTGGKRVITIDIHDWGYAYHPLVTYMIGLPSVDKNVIDQVGNMVSGGTVMVVLDGNHNWKNVYAELISYGPMVTKGQFIVIEDCYREGYKEFFPMRAKKRFMSETNEFIEEPLGDRFVFAATRAGWLKKVND